MECPGFAGGNESTFRPNIGPFFLFIISFIYNCRIENMSSHDEAEGSARLEEDPIEAANHYFDYLDEHQMGVHGGGSGTNPDTDTGTSTGTGTDTTPETSNDAVVAGKAPKQKRTRKPNELGIGQIVVTEMHPKKLEPTVPEEARSKWGNQLGCILRETANISDEKLKKIPHMEHMLLKKLCNRFMFPGRTESKELWDGDAMKKINSKAIVSFTNNLSA
jgi:hypothetical protein